MRCPWKLRRHRWKWMEGHHLTYERRITTLSTWRCERCGRLTQREMPGHVSAEVLKGSKL